MQITTPREESQSEGWKFGVFLFCSVPKECVCSGAEGVEILCPARAGYFATRKLKAMSTLLPQEHPLHPSRPGRVGAGKGGAEQRVPQALPGQDEPGCCHRSQQRCQKPRPGKGPGFRAAPPCPQHSAKLNCGTRSLLKCHPQARVPEHGGLPCQAKSMALRPTPCPCPHAGRRPAAHHMCPAGTWHALSHGTWATVAPSRLAPPHGQHHAHPHGPVGWPGLRARLHKEGQSSAEGTWPEVGDSSGAGGRRAGQGPWGE